MLQRRMLVLLSAILFVKNLQGLQIYKYGSVRIPYMEVIGERRKRHFVYANLLIWSVVVPLQQFIRTLQLVIISESVFLFIGLAPNVIVPNWYNNNTAVT